MSGPAGAALRAEAARALVQVLGEGRSLKATLGRVLPNIPDPRDRALLEAICFGVLRHWRRYEAVLAQWLARPLARRDYPVHCLLLAGLAQLDALGLPAHAAVGATAEAARSLGHAPLVGLVNALLRRATREPWPVPDAPALATSHPDWLLHRLQQDWPDDWPAILAANNAQAPLWLRARGGAAARDALRARLAEAGLSARTDPALEEGLCLDDPVPVERLPGWQSGQLAVQDGAAQLAVAALAPRPGERVLDACAAPGGKAAQVAERLAGQGSLLALDVEARRLARVERRLAEFGLSGPSLRCQLADAAAPEAWWDGQPFDAILLDAPCSATGVIRRQPDIKWHRQEADVAALVQRQAALLDALWPTLAPGGRLLYATCSVLAAENAGQVAAFLGRHPDASAGLLDLDWRFGRVAGDGRQRLPGEDRMDGFFYALLHKAG